MDSGRIRPPLGLRIKGVLSAGSEVSSYLAVDSSAARKSRWVVKALEQEGRGVAPPGEILRRDMADLVSLSHICLALPRCFDAGRGSSGISWARHYIEGADLPAVLKGLTPKDLLVWMILAAEALEILHRFGFLHRNLKPSNFIVPRSALSARGSGDARVVLCDPAWWQEADDARRQGELVAPEVQAGERATFATDLHALGRVFYHLLTGKEPRHGRNGTLRVDVDGRSSLLTDLSRILTKLLAVDPRSRYPRAQALIEDLRGLAGLRSSPVTALPDYFFGRRDELARILKALKDPRRGLACAIGGEAGMGKSALLRRVSLEAQLLGHRTVRFGYSLEGGVLPPTLEMLFGVVAPEGARGRTLRARFRQLLEALDLDHNAERRRWLVQELLDLFLAAVASEPLLILIDDFEKASPLVVELLAALVAEISAAERGGGPVEGRAAVRVIVAYRSESPFRSLLQPLFDVIEPRGKQGESSSLTNGSSQIELAPLSEDAISEWVDMVLPADAGTRDQILYTLQLHGRPFSIQEALRVGASRWGEALALGADPAGAYAAYMASLGALERDILEVLAVLGRAAGLDLLRVILESRAQALEPAVESLLRTGALAAESGAVSLRHGSFRAWILTTLQGAPGQDLFATSRVGVWHRRVAQALEGRKGEAEAEVAHHWLLSPTPRKGFAAARRVARELAAQGEDRRAIEIYRDLLRIIAAEGGAESSQLREEAAEVYSRLGEHSQSIELLEKLLPDRHEKGGAASLHGRLGIFCHRAGDVGRAVAHLEEGLSLLAGVRGPRALRDRLRIASELAEIACKKGDYVRAQSLCAGALKEIQGARASRTSSEVRHAEMVLLETLAHVKLRRFEHDEARGLFERSLAISEEIGATVERSLILNNLAVLHNQQNRFQEAIECYQEAERLSTRRGGDMSLVNVHSNLAHLYAKIGQPEAAEEAVQRASYHDARLGSKRTRFLRLHCSGLVDLCFGRYETALETFQEASAIAEELEDYFLASFDLVYLGECHLFRGDHEAAEAALDRALRLSSTSAPPVVAMVAARKAALSALRHRLRDARLACEAAPAQATVAIPYVDAWNDLFYGWANRLIGERDEAARRLEAARAFFARVGSPQGEIHAELELVALDTDGRDFSNAEKRLRALRARHACGRGALKNPMLSARLLACHARLLLEQGGGDLDEAAGYLVDAEAFLVSRRLRDLEVILKELRQRVDVLREQGGGAPLADATSRSPLAPPRVDLEAIIGQSAALRAVIAQVEQLGTIDLPVLITGETGTGKELVARAIHGVSSRRGGPFVSLNCAALPEELLEAELFGYVKGAFSSAEADHPGLLVGAQGGTVLFDEVGEIPLVLQAKLLRVLDRGQVRPIGGVGEIKVDVRFLFSSNRDLRALVDEGKFRNDLFFRFGAFEVKLPPLRERREDLPALVDHFRRQSGAARPLFDERALSALAAHSWPGNVRELENVVKRLVLTHAERITAPAVQGLLGKTVEPALFSPQLLKSKSLDELQTQLEREYLRQLHKDRGGSLKAMAAELGITLKALYKRLSSLGIRPGDLGGEKKL